MTYFRLALLSVRHHQRMALGVALCSAVATAILTGALIVGDSAHRGLIEHAERQLGALPQHSRRCQ